MFEFQVPVITGTNHGYHIVHVNGHCRIAKMPAVETWQTEVAYKTRLARPTGWVAARRVRIEVSVWFNRSGRDADGILKFLLDGIAHGLGVNDTIFLPTVLVSEVDRKDPRILVRVENEADEGHSRIEGLVANA